ncbi:DNA -binding domain-containing protein [Methylocapsa sp. S129]
MPERAWKTHDLRNRTIRLVKSGLALMHGGYRELLHLSRRKK